MRLKPNRLISRKLRLTNKSRRIILRAATAIETLESRILLSSDYLLNGNQLTTTTNGASTTTTVPDINHVVLTGDSGTNRFTVQNFAGTVSIDGQGGGDIINLYAGTGGTFHIHDSSPTPGNPDSLIVRAPATFQTTVTAGESQVAIGSDMVSYDATIASVSLIGQLFSNGDALTVNASTPGEAVAISGSTLKLGSGPTIYYSTFNHLTVSDNTGGDSFAINGDSIPTTVNAAGGSRAFVVNSNSVPLTLNGSAARIPTPSTATAAPWSSTGRGEPIHLS